MKKALEKVVVLLILLVGGYFVNDSQNNGINQEKEGLEQLFKDRQSGKIVTFKAQVIKRLADDKEGDRHQKMILRVGNNTLLLAHNIDIAERVPVRKGDSIQVRGQYEWNNKGGVVHWTHKDNNNKHPHGWIKHKNKIYQ